MSNVLRFKTCLVQKKQNNIYAKLKKCMKKLKINMNLMFKVVMKKAKILKKNKKKTSKNMKLN